MSTGATGDAAPTPPLIERITSPSLRMASARAFPQGQHGPLNETRLNQLEFIFAYFLGA
jgi:hypothetical protein